jgi:multidrug efflux pump subunit AcrA (membrane-fusion protein)
MHLLSATIRQSPAAAELARAQTELARAHNEIVAQQARDQAQQARDQAQQAREQAQVVRDQARVFRDQLMREMRPQIMVPCGQFGNSRREQGMLFTGFVIVVFAAVIILHPIARALGRRLDGSRRPLPLPDDASAARLERIEQTVDAMAIEIERISEGQRFTTRLLANRHESPLPLER